MVDPFFKVIHGGRQYYIDFIYQGPIEVVSGHAMIVLRCPITGSMDILCFTWIAFPKKHQLQVRMGVLESLPVSAP